MRDVELVGNQIVDTNQIQLEKDSIMWMETLNILCIENFIVFDREKEKTKTKSVRPSAGLSEF